MELVRKLNAEFEEIIDLKKRSGFFGFIYSGFEAVTKRLAKIKPIIKNPQDYDFIIVLSPVWVSSLSSPVRTYLTNYGDKIKKVAFLAT